MKLGFIIYGSLEILSGGYLYDRKLVEYLRSQGDTVEIISLPWRNYAAHLTDNLHFRLPPGLDLLIQDELNHPSLIAANRGRHPYPVISLVHHLRCSERRPAWQNTFYSWMEEKYLRSVDGFIFNSSTTRKAVEALLKNGKPGIVAYPPTDRFGPPLSEQEITQRATSGQLRILFLGNVIARKGLHTLLQAISHQPPTFRVDVVGSLTTEPQYTRRIQELIAANHLSASVFLHGSLDKEPLVEAFRAANVLVVPSSYEGFGMVYLEGMGFGLPAIGTTEGAAPEIIEHGKTGYLISPQDSRSLAGHLQSLTEDRDLLTRLSLHARERYLRQPPWNETARKVREFLHVMARPSQPAYNS
jgi:glycosyltransferase involved in cell wall biosynthesis